MVNPQICGLTTQLTASSRAPLWKFLDKPVGFADYRVIITHKTSDKPTVRQKTDMIYARIEAYPFPRAAENRDTGGAIVNCWIERDDIDEAVSVARRMISERGWYSESVEEARICTREEFPEEGREYYDQAVTDREVLVFYTYPKNEEG